ncbi:MAG: adenylate kinase [Candidatus Dormibacteria bacterium]
MSALTNPEPLPASVDVLFLGAPGSGKGTQSGRLASTLSVPHIATGDILRREMTAGTDLGEKARQFYDSGGLVPDEVMIGIVRRRLAEPDCGGGFLLDGFPRNRTQAEALDGALADLGRRVDAAIYLDVPDDVLIARLSGRWLCRSCGASHHSEYDPPQVAGRCNRCGGELFQRVDDSPATARRRIDLFLSETRPLLEYYRQQGVLAEVNGVGSIDQVAGAIVAALPGGAR